MNERMDRQKQTDGRTGKQFDGLADEQTDRKEEWTGT